MDTWISSKTWQVFAINFSSLSTLTPTACVCMPLYWIHCKGVFHVTLLLIQHRYKTRVNTVNPRINPLGGLFMLWIFAWRLIRGGLIWGDGSLEGRAYSRGGASIFFLLVEHISFEIGLPISYFLMLQIQATWCFLKDVRYFVNKWLNFLSYLYKALIKSQIATVTCLGGAFSRGLINNFSSGVGK